MTEKLETLRSLQKRLREATGPDRELDAEIAAAFLGGRAYHAPAGYKGFQWVRRTTDDDHTGGVNFEVANYTTDPDGLGACVALMREVLPGWRKDSTQLEVFKVYVWHPDRYTVTNTSDQHALETHALLLAIIAARIAVIEDETKERVG